jgi:hypothetical protein
MLVLITAGRWHRRARQECQENKTHTPVSDDHSFVCYHRMVGGLQRSKEKMPL